MATVTVKWGKETYKVERESAEGGLEIFQAVLQSLTSVAVDKQKLLVKGKVIKDDASLATALKKKVVKFMLMGSVTELPKAPTKPIVFREDLPPEQREDSLPSGLHNLGNTCYMNSTVQALRSVPELQTSLTDLAKSSPNAFDMSTTVPQTLGQLYKAMDNSAPEPCNPSAFWVKMRQAFPQFDETDENGRHKQQDADEFYTNLMQTLRAELKDTSSLSDEQKTDQDVVSALFNGELETVTKCADNDKEPEVREKSAFDKLKCHISNKTDLVSQGIRDSLTEEIMKKGTLTDDNLKFERTSKITKLPPYLTIQFVRFFWKADISKKAKIMRKVTFPVDRRLDLVEFCSDELAEKLGANRKAKLDKEDRERERRQKTESDEAAKTDEAGAATAASSSSSSAMDTSPDSTSSKPAANDESKGGDNSMDTSDDEPIGETGFYQLSALVTHQGAYADGGHYVGWVRKGPDNWLCFDDDKVTEVTDKEIKDLMGRGQWHSAYLAIFRKMSSDEEVTDKPEQ